MHGLSDMASQLEEVAIKLTSEVRNRQVADSGLQNMQQFGYPLDAVKLAWFEPLQRCSC